MKTKILSVLSVSALSIALTITSAHAYLIDTFLAKDTINSGDAAELAFIRTAAGDNSLTLDFKLEEGDTGFNFASNGPDSWFIDVDPDTPGYFLLKFGIGGTNAGNDSHFVFQNIGDLTKLVWSNDQVDNLTGGNCASNPNKCNIGRLSHYAGTNGDGGTPPEEIPSPMSLLLLGAGLMGMAFVRRRQSI